MSEKPESQGEQQNTEEVQELQDEAREADAEISETDLQHALADAQTKAQDNWDLYMRSQAELENAKRRADKNVENAHKYALEKFSMELLGVKDSLELGLSAEDADANKLKEGTELTLKMLTQVMEKFDIHVVDPLGDAFDPNLHQAMTMQESSEHKPNTVMAVMQKGYTLNDRLLRPAMVMVSKASG